MQLARIVYVSRPAPDLKLSDVSEIVESARRNNPRANITGFLTFRHDVFLQVLEGGREAISELTMRIGADERHSDFVLLDYSTIPERDFGSWSMGFLPLPDASRDLVQRFSATKELDFMTMPVPAIIGLCKALAERASMQRTQAAA